MTIAQNSSENLRTSESASEPSDTLHNHSGHIRMLKILQNVREHLRIFWNLSELIITHVNA